MVVGSWTAGSKERRGWTNRFCLQHPPEMVLIYERSIILAVSSATTSTLIVNNEVPQRKNDIEIEGLVRVFDEGARRWQMKRLLSTM